MLSVTVHTTVIASRPPAIVLYRKANTVGTAGAEYVTLYSFAGTSPSAAPMAMTT